MSEAATVGGSWKQEAMEILNTIGDPCSAAHGQSMGIVDMGLIDTLELYGSGVLEVNIRLTSPCCAMVGYFSDEARKRLEAIDGVQDVTVHFDEGLEWQPSMMSEGAQHRRQLRLLSLGISA